MRYYKRIENGYITACGVDCGGIEITQDEYEQIVEAVKSRPNAEDEFVYMLKDDITWELLPYKIESE